MITRFVALLGGVILSSKNEDQKTSLKSDPFIVLMKVDAGGNSETWDGEPFDKNNFKIEEAVQPSGLGWSVPPSPLANIY